MENLHISKDINKFKIIEFYFRAIFAWVKGKINCFDFILKKIVFVFLVGKHPPILSSTCHLALENLFNRFIFFLLQGNLQNIADEVILWSNHRVMEWLRTIDLSEYAPNLRGSGVHGALMVSQRLLTFCWAKILIVGYFIILFFLVTIFFKF